MELYSTGSAHKLYKKYSKTQVDLNKVTSRVYYWLLALSIVFSGCLNREEDNFKSGEKKSTTHSDTQTKDEALIMRTHAIKIATEHLRDIGMLYEKYSVSVTTGEDGRFEVLFTFLPKTPGAHTLVVIKKDGTVTDVGPGA